MYSSFQTAPSPRRSTPIVVIAVCAVLLAACGSSTETDTETETGAAAAQETVEVADETGAAETADSGQTAADTSGTGNFQVDVWADNWMAVYVDGELIGEDSVSITTERSFNAESFTFDAAYPFTVAIEAKDFKETDSGLEYIGEGNQQMGDGGLIAQITDLSSGEVVATTGDDWVALVVHRAPLNTECENSNDPDGECEFEIIETPEGWTGVGFDDSTWTSATVWSEGDVGPKDGYDQIDWDGGAALIWGSDLEVDNTVLLRSTVTGG